jgi:hypothetical protein
MSYNIYRGQRPQIDDFVSVLPSGNKIIKTGEDSVVTNCVHPNHDDKNPSMGSLFKEWWHERQTWGDWR